MIMLGNKGDSTGGSQARPMSTPRPQASEAPVEQVQAPANVSDEEIRIEDIPF
jgi:hypothetical protein